MTELTKPEMLQCLCGAKMGVMKAAGVFQAVCSDYRCPLNETFGTEKEARDNWNKYAKAAQPPHPAEDEGGDVLTIFNAAQIDDDMWQFDEAELNVIRQALTPSKHPDSKPGSGGEDYPDPADRWDGWPDAPRYATPSPSAQISGMVGEKDIALFTAGLEIAEGVFNLICKENNVGFASMSRHTAAKYVEEKLIAILSAVKDKA